MEAFIVGLVLWFTCFVTWYFTTTALVQKLLLKHLEPYSLLKITELAAARLAEIDMILLTARSSVESLHDAVHKLLPTFYEVNGALNQAIATTAELAETVEVIRLNLQEVRAWVAPQIEPIEVQMVKHRRALVEQLERYLELNGYQVRGKLRLLMDAYRDEGPLATVREAHDG
jgi:hypothetical protein